MITTHVLSHTHSEPFDPLRLHASIVRACLAVQSHEGLAHSTAENVCQRVIEWLVSKYEVTSDDIRRVAGVHLATYHPDAAYFYQHEQVMI